MTGTRGPLPKPAALRLLEGNPGKRALNLSEGVNPEVRIPTAPKHLGREAKKTWDRTGPILEELGLVSDLDVAAFTLYCDAYGTYCEYQTTFKGKVRLLVGGGIDHSEAVFQASVTTTPNGYQQMSVIRQLIKSQGEQVNRYLMHFGMSPAARGRVQAYNYVQPDLPGVEAAPKVRTGFAQFAIVGP